MSQRRNTKPSIFSWINQRECGGSVEVPGRRFQPLVPGGVESCLWKNVWRDASSSRGSIEKHPSGGIFGLRYSPNGEILVGACENNCLIFVDPVTEKVIKFQENAHDSCCNNLSFLDDRMFASCSDDCTVAVWDLRNLSNKVFSLCDHGSWVKNVELHRPSRRLVSSGFDGTVRLWDLNAVCDGGEVRSKILLKVQGLLRMKLSPLGDSMYISSNDFYDVIGIHNLDLDNLQKDVEFLKKIRGSRGVRAKKKTTITPDSLRQSLSISKRNHIDVFWRDCVVSEYGLGGLRMPCHSIDVHPRNSAVLLHHICEHDKLTAVHNTKRQYCYAYDLDDNEEFEVPLTRGLVTNYLSQETMGSGDYMEEVSFSPCGRLIASPMGYGAVLAVYDQDFNDYESYIAKMTYRLPSKKNPTSKSGSKSKANNSCHLSLAPRKLESVEQCLGHRSPVLSTCFSPSHIQLATGSEEGLIVLHNPEVIGAKAFISDNSG